MQSEYNRFIGCDSEFEDAEYVLFGAPFDGTTSYRPGTRFGPSVMRRESFGIETYSPYQYSDLCDYRIFDAGDLELPFGNTARVLDMIEHMTSRIITRDKKPVMIGGEHLVTLGAVRALVKKYPNLRIIHLDAHADLRDEYLGEKLSHATVMRRCSELVGMKNIYQFGIRSGTAEEFMFGQIPNPIIALEKIDEEIENILFVIEDNPVYITLDLDVLDPSIFPGTGTPEHNGCTVAELLAYFMAFSNLNVVGFDLVELSPPYDPSGISTAAANLILREMFMYFSDRQKRRLMNEDDLFADDVGEDLPDDSPDDLPDDPDSYEVDSDEDDPDI
jgi:agmatinase